MESSEGFSVSGCGGCWLVRSPAAGTWLYKISFFATAAMLACEICAGLSIILAKGVGHQDREAGVRISPCSSGPTCKARPANELWPRERDWSLTRDTKQDEFPSGSQDDLHGL